MVELIDSSENKPKSSDRAIEALSATEHNLDGIPFQFKSQ